MGGVNGHRWVEKRVYRKGKETGYSRVYGNFFEEGLKRILMNYRCFSSSVTVSFLA